jgi:hypothetical protein
MVMCGHLYYPAALTREKPPVPIEGWVDFRSRLDAWEKGISFIPAGIRKPDHPARSLFTILTELSLLRQFINHYSYFSCSFCFCFYVTKRLARIL